MALATKRAATAKGKTKAKPPAKKTPRKTGKQKQPRTAAQAPAAQTSFLDTVKDVYPDITSEFFVTLYKIPPEDEFRLRTFVNQYLKDFDPFHACIRMGYPDDVASSNARIFLGNAYVQLKVQEVLAAAQADSIVSGNQVLAALWKEANRPDMVVSGCVMSNSASRIAALKELAKIKQLSAPQNDKGSGIGVVVHHVYVDSNGTASAEAWERAAIKEQGDLKRQVAIEVEAIGN